MCGGAVWDGLQHGRPPDVQPRAALIIIHPAVVTLQPLSTTPSVAGCHLVDCSVIS
jgi:hypothetical protein